MLGQDEGIGFWLCKRLGELGGPDSGSLGRVLEWSAVAVRGILVPRRCGTHQAVVRERGVFWSSGG